MTEETMKRTNTHGGARDGAGRKKSLPDGAKPSTFILTEDEKLAVKDYIVSMRREASGKPKVSINLEEELFKLAFQMLKPVAATMIKVNGGRPWGKIEKLLKDAAVMAFKDAVCDYEREHGLK